MQTPIFICNALVIHIYDIMVLSTDLAVALINYKIFIFIINLLLNKSRYHILDYLLYLFKQLNNMLILI